MSLDHAILGFLTYRPMSGYDLKGMFDQSVRHFWPADQSQIYRTLARLAERRWADVEVVEQEARPDRKVYRVTAAGRAELQNWLNAPPDTGGERIAHLVRIFFAANLSDEEVLAMLRGLADDCRAAHDELAALDESCRADGVWDASPRAAFFARLTLEYGLRGTAWKLKWLEEVIDRIRRNEHEKGVGE